MNRSIGCSEPERAGTGGAVTGCIDHSPAALELTPLRVSLAPVESPKRAFTANANIQRPTHTRRSHELPSGANNPTRADEAPSQLRMVKFDPMETSRSHTTDRSTRPSPVSQLANPQRSADARALWGHSNRCCLKIGIFTDRLAFDPAGSHCAQPFW